LFYKINHAMESYHLDQDIKVFCVTAKIFPEGVQEAYDTLNKLINTQGCTFYGLSKPTEKGEIVYKAAVAENFEGEAVPSGLEAFVIPKGEYITETIYDWKNNMQKFGPTFMSLLDNPKLDWSSWCIEWYKDDEEVMCMVKVI
jgi:predicted transcriptional regulator YdeE